MAQRLVPPPDGQGGEEPTAPDGEHFNLTTRSWIPALHTGGSPAGPPPAGFSLPAFEAGSPFEPLELNGIPESFVIAGITVETLVFNPTVGVGGLLLRGESNLNPTLDATYNDVGKYTGGTIETTLPSGPDADGPTNLTANGAMVRTSLNDTIVFTHKATDDFGGAGQKSVTLTWTNEIMWGSAPDGTLNQAFIDALSDDKLAKNYLGDLAMVGAPGEYLWIAIPVEYEGTPPTFTVGAAPWAHTKAATIAYTNVNAVAVVGGYSLYKSDTAGLGATTVKVQ